MRNRMLSTIVCAALAAAWAGPADADEAVKQAGKIMQDYSKAVVAVEAVLTISAEGSLASLVGANQEQKVQITGTVVDPSGLTVVSYVNLNPASAVKNAKVRGPGGQEMSLSLKGELSDVKICLPDGTEIPARVVMKDEDLDMAFIMPKDKLDSQAAGQIQAVDLAKPAPKAQRLDQMVRLGRLGKDMNRELVIDIDRISAIIAKPRTLYIVGGAQPGAPVFAMNGELLGIVIFHKKPGSGSSGLMGAQNIGGTPAVLPTEDVRKIADQAREEAAKAPATTQPTTKEAQTKEAPAKAAD